MADEPSRAGQVSREYDTIVVGAGIAGLAYAHGRGAAADVLVLEGSDRPGGVIVTGQDTATGDSESFHYECGPEALQDNAPETLALLDELGLQPLPASSSAGHRWILLERDNLVPVPTGPKALLGSKLLSFSAKWRLAKGLWSHSPGDCDGSLAHFVRSRFGDELLERLVDPAISGIYAGDPELISLRAAFPTLYELASEHGSLFAGMRAKGRARRAAQKQGSGPAPRRGAPSLLSVEGGLESLPRAIASWLGERLVLNCRVVEVTRGGQGWLVKAGDGTEYRARQVVLALPVAQAAAVLASSIPEISEACASQHSESVINLVHLWRREDVSHPLDGFGYLVPSKLGASHLGTLFSSSIQPVRCPSDRVLLRTLMGGARRPELLEHDHDQLLEIAVNEVGGTLGIRPGARPLFSRAVRWPGVLPRYDLDHPARQATIQAMLARNPGLEIIGNHRQGISVNALIASSRLLARSHSEGDQVHA